MSTPRGIALYVAAIVGPGILTLPALAARRAGPASLVALGVLLLVSIAIASTFVALARRVPLSGGVAAYAEAAFGPAAGRLTGYWFYLGVPVGVTALGLIGGGYVAAATGGGRPVTVAVATGIVAISLIAAAREAGLGGQLPLVLTALLVALVLTTALIAMPHADGGNLTPFAPHGWAAVPAAAVPLIWVLTGWEAVTPLAHRLRHPGRVAGWSLAIVAVLFAAVAVPEILVLGPDAGDTDAPIAALLKVGLGAGAAVAAAVFAVIVATGNAIAYSTGIAEIGATLRTRRVLIAPAAIMVAGLAAAAFTPVGTGELVELCAGSQVPVYMLGLAAGVRLLPRGAARGVAVVATAAVTLLLVPVGWYLLAPAAITLGVLPLLIGRRRPRGVNPTAGASRPEPGGVA